MDEIKSYVLWGSTGHAKVLAEIIRLRGGRVIALFENNPEVISCLPGIPLYYGEAGFYEWLRDQKSLQGIGACLAVGGVKGQDRLNLAQQFQNSGLSLPTLIHPSASLSSTANIGEGCQILANAVVAADVTMGRVCIVNNSANVDHECCLGKGVHVAPGAVLCGCVSVSDNVMIGAGAVVLPRLVIGKGAIVGAGAVVTRDVPDGSMVAGNPAKIIRREND